MADLSTGDSCLISAGEPRILTRIGLLPNPSFEDGTVGVTPTSWTKGGAGGNTAVKNADQVFDRGDGNSAYAMKVTRTSGNIWIDAKTAAGVVVPGVDWVFCCAIYIEGPSQPDIRITLETQTAADAQVDFATDTASSGWTVGAWNFAQARLPVPASTPTATKFQVRLNCNFIAIGEPIWFDYCHLGVASDFDRRFTTWETSGQPRGTLNVGDGTYEAVRLADPLEKIKIGYKRIMEGQPRADAWHEFMREAVNMQPFTIWRERNNWTHLEGHREIAISTGSYKYKYQPGMARFPGELTIETPLERRLARRTAQ